MNTRAAPRTTLSAEAIERIVQAVGHDVTPDDLCRESLAKDLVSDVRVHIVVSKVSSARQQRETFDQLCDISAQVRKLYTALTEVDELRIRYEFSRALSGESAARAGPSYEDLLAGLRRLHDTAKKRARLMLAVKRENGSFELMHLSRSVLDRLIDTSLRDTFKKHFHREAGRSRPKAYESRKKVSRRTSGKAQGPFIRFVEAVLQEFAITKSNGEPYAPETIAAALRPAKLRKRPALTGW